MTFKSTIKSISLIFILLTVIKAQSDPIITEIMFSPSVDGSRNEFVELYNPTNATIDLSNYQIKYSTSSGDFIIALSGSTLLSPSSFALVVEGDYDPLNTPYSIPGSALIVQIDDNAFGSSGMANSSDRDVALLDGSDNVLSTYTYTANNSAGISDEKITLNTDNTSSNWANSTVTNGTPGYKNSVSPKEDDLAVWSIALNPSQPIEDQIIIATVTVKNLGINTADSYKVLLYEDTDFDSTAEAGELINSITLTNLASGDSISQNFGIGFYSTGDLSLIAIVEFAADQDTSNNQLVNEFTIKPLPPAFNDVVINEIMYDPSSGEPEWVEIYNRSTTSYLIKDWTFSDASSSKTITTFSIRIDPDEYIVLAASNDIHNFYDIRSRVIVVDLPSLNNSGDMLLLKDFNSNVVDTFNYLSSWGGGDGISLERINPDETSNNELNWGSSVSPFNATPGGINSLTPKEYDLSISSVTFEPTPVIEGDIATINVLVKNLGSEGIPLFTSVIYLDENQDSVSDASEQFDQDLVGPLNSGDSLIIPFSFGNTEPGKYYFIIKIQHSGDQYIFNNVYYATLSVGGKPIAYNSLVINEIMYTPQDDEPEWVELYNRSTSPVNIRGWYISDESNSTVIVDSNYIIQPDSFVVVADNDKIYDYYNFPIPVITTNLPTLNNSGDAVIISDSLFFTNDSLKYTSSWGGSSGKSLERIDPNIETTLNSNWGTSISSDGATPGKANSIVPREYDAALTFFNSQSSYLFQNENSTLNIGLQNTGTNSITGKVNIFYDVNGDSSFSVNELIETLDTLDLSPSQEIERDVTHIFTSFGNAYLLAVCEFNNDTYTENDSLFLTKEVIEPNANRGEIVINEFLYAPTSPYAEWIELYNTTDKPQQLRNFAIADSRDTVTISNQNILIPEHSYVVLSRDSITTQLYDIPSQVVINEFPSLNNSGDRIMLLDNYKRVIDSLEYTSNWGGENGKSVERISPFGSSVLSSNWGTSIDSALGTPGKINSLFPLEYDVAIDSFYSTPAQPESGESVQFFATVINNGINTADFSLLLYDSNSDGDKVRLLETVQINQLNSFEEKEINFSYKIDTFNEDQFFIVEAQYSLDQNTNNNSQFLFVASPTTALSLVVNEIMFDPDDDEPEWIELFNRSQSSINLKNWQVADVITNPEYVTITTQDVFVEPGGYIILSKDSGIFNFHHGLTEQQVILVPFANLNNATDGVVIYERLGNLVDSVFYSSEFTRKSGYSIERLSPEGLSNDPTNWNYSIADEKSTPGFINSRSPKDHDLEVVDLIIDPEFPELGNSIVISAYIKNTGLIDASSFTFSFVSIDFGISETITVPYLEAGKTDIVSLSSSYNMPESFTMTAEINYDKDENLSNNTFTKTFYSGYPPSSVLVNEVMYDPNDNGTEWVEFVNASVNRINLNGWKIAEGSTHDSPKTITQEDKVIQPGKYFVVADDTSGGKFANVEVPVFQLNFGELNSSEDIVAIFDFRGAQIDSLKYSSSWGGGDGYSLERLSLQSPTNQRTNWMPSIVINGSTPGSANSTSNIATPEAKQVVINEVMFEPETGNSEFIEFLNTSDKFVEIANWSVEDDSKNITTLSRSTFTVSPDSYFVIAADSSILMNYPELSELDQLIIADKNLSLNNSDDLILLKDPFGNVIDSVYYNSIWHNQREITTKNKSLERINPFLDGNDKNNWSTSVANEGATPGKANSIYIENQSSTNTISVSPNPFSPDGDGYEDFVIINYNLPRDVTSIQIKVFDSKGRKVRTINENNIFGKTGSIIFDGYNDDGQPLKIGIYILFIEALNSSSGTVDTFKEVVVVARKL